MISKHTATLSVMVDERLDVDEELDNKEGHFRTVCIGCTHRVVSGLIIQSNCGKLFRIGGNKLSAIDSNRKCPSCVKSRGMKPCPFCGDFDIPDGWL